MRTYLIHLHPQFTYLFRCLLAIAHEHLATYGQTRARIILLQSPTFLDQLNNHFIDYLEISGILTQLSANLSFELLFYRWPECTSAVKPSDSLILTEKQSILFNQSVFDSIYRDLDPSQKAIDYYKGDPSVRAGIFSTRNQKALKLLQQYASLIAKYNVESVYMSHSHYDFYISLGLATSLSGAIVRICHSGFFWTYELTSRDVDSYSPVLGISQLLEPLSSHISCLSCVPASTNLLKKSNVVHVKVNSLASILSSYQSYRHSNARLSSNKRVLIFCFPTLRELTSWTPDSAVPRIFENRYDFLRTSLAYAADSDNVLVFARIHPMSHEYGELSILESLISHANHYRSHPIRTPSSIDEYLKLLVNSSADIASIDVVTTDGSIALELSQHGIQAFCTQNTFAPQNSFFFFESIQRYISFLRSETVTSKPTLSLSLRRLASVYNNLYNKLTLKHPDSRYGKFLETKLSRIYHFGNVSRHLDSAEIAECFHYAYDNFRPRLLVSRDQTHMHYP